MQVGRVARGVVLAVLCGLTAACAADPPTGDEAEPTGTTTEAGTAWSTCRTRLDFDRVVVDVADPDPSVRAAALALAETLPPPAGSEQAWITLVEILRRYVDLGQQVQETEPEAFRRAVDQLAEQDLAMTSLTGLTDEEQQRRLGQLRVAGPCDPIGMGDEFGCADPQECTTRWIDAVERGDAAALGRLGSVWLRPFGAEVAGVAPGACAEASDRPGVQRCPFEGPVVKGSVDWNTTTDGRWYGVDAEVSTFEPVGSAVP